MANQISGANGFLTQLQNFARNPMQYLMQRNLPKSAVDDPQGAVQQLLNSGEMTQQQFNQLQAMAKQIANSPQFAQLFQHR